MNPRLNTTFFLSVLVVLFIAIFPTSNVSADEALNSLALTNGTIIDGKGGTPLPNGVLVIENGVITAVGSQGSVSIPNNIRVINLKGATILPGFINAHVHAAYDEKRLARWAKAGVTTVRDLAMDSNQWTIKEMFSFRDRVLNNPKLARLVAAGPMVTVTDGYPACWGVGAIHVDSPDDAKKKVNELIDAGADLIKIPLEAGLGGNKNWPTLTDEEAAAIVQTAHQRKLRVSVHVTSSDQLERALDAGIDDIAHMVTDQISDKEVSQRIAVKNIYWIPTLELLSGMNSTSTMTVIYQNLRDFNEARGKIALGTDFAGAKIYFQLGMPMIEMEKMTMAGMTPMQIIVAATKNAAYVCNREKVLGTLEKGKWADILVVDGDPLKDLHNLLKVKYVFHSGVMIRGN